MRGRDLADQRVSVVAAVDATSTLLDIGRGETHGGS